MDSVKVKKDELLKILKKNRANHREIFEEASVGFRKEAIRILDQRLEDAKNNRRINLRINLVQPVDQTEEYDQAIEMCNMSVDSEIVLSSEAFRNYVLDKWHWKDNFIASNSRYSTKAALIGTTNRAMV